MPVYKNPDFRCLPLGLDAIFAEQSRSSFFALPLWYDLLTRFAVPDRSEIRLYTDERPGSTVALLLRVAEGAVGRSLTSLANYYSVEHALLSPPDADLERGLRAVLMEILAERPRWDYLQLAELDPRDHSYHAIVRMLRRNGFIVECVSGAGTWFEDTRGLGFSDYLAARPSQLRSTWRRKSTRLLAAGCLTKAFFSDAAEIDRAIAHYQAIYAASWKPPEAFPRFIPALIRLAAELGALRLGIYYIDGIPAAAQFWILWDGRAVIYKLAHARQFNGLSLGTILTMEMIERILHLDQPSEINLGRGDDPYKRLWLTKRRERRGITAANPRTLIGLRLGIEREAAKLYHRFRGKQVDPIGLRGPARS